VGNGKYVMGAYWIVAMCESRCRFCRVLYSQLGMKHFSFLRDSMSRDSTKVDGDGYERVFSSLAMCMLVPL
jgi:hypothetical protein